MISRKFYHRRSGPKTEPKLPLWTKPGSNNFDFNTQVRKLKSKSNTYLLQKGRIIWYMTEKYDDGNNPRAVLSTRYAAMQPQA